MSAPPPASSESLGILARNKKYKNYHNNKPLLLESDNDKLLKLCLMQKQMGRFLDGFDRMCGSYLGYLDIGRHAGKGRAITAGVFPNNSCVRATALAITIVRVFFANQLAQWVYCRSKRRFTSCFWLDRVSGRFLGERTGKDAFSIQTVNSSATCCPVRVPCRCPTILMVLSSIKINRMFVFPLR